MLNRVPTDSSINYQTFSFGDYITGIAYWKAGLNASSLPAVVWLHPYSYNTGFTPTYGDGCIHLDLAKAGYVAIVFDQVGFATRIREGGTAFYARHGAHASLFGHMVRDVRAAVDVVQCLGTEAQRQSPGCGTGEQPGSTYPAQTALRHIPVLDTNRVYLAGFSLGGNVALHAAALDSRVVRDFYFVIFFVSFFVFLNEFLQVSPTLFVVKIVCWHGLLWSTQFNSNCPLLYVSCLSSTYLNNERACC